MAIFASVSRRIVVAADGCLVETYALVQRDGGNVGCSHLQPQRDDAEFFDFINDMLQQRFASGHAALVRGIDSDIEQRRLIQYHLRNGESCHFAIYRQLIVAIALPWLLARVCSLHGKRGRVFSMCQALVKSAVLRVEIVFMCADLLPRAPCEPARWSGVHQKRGWTPGRPPAAATPLCPTASCCSGCPAAASPPAPESAAGPDLASRPARVICRQSAALSATAGFPPPSPDEYVQEAR